MKLRHLVVLLAEDQDDDVVLFQRAISKTVGTHTLKVVENGEEAIRYLQGEGPFNDRNQNPFPTVLLLDIKMPRKGGLEVLQWLHDHEDCNVIPTIMFTSSEQSEDIREAFKSGANAFFTKPVSLQEWAELMGAIFSYWCRSHVPTPPPQRKCR